MHVTDEGTNDVDLDSVVMDAVDVMIEDVVDAAGLTVAARVIDQTIVLTHLKYDLMLNCVVESVLVLLVTTLTIPLMIR